MPTDASALPLRVNLCGGIIVMGAERSDKLILIRKGRDLIIKFNPYHGYHGYFSSRDAHTDFSPGSGRTRALSIARENKRRIAEGNTELVGEDYSIHLKGGKSTYAQARAESTKGGGKSRSKESGNESKTGSVWENESNLIFDHDLKDTEDMMLNAGIGYKKASVLERPLSESEIIAKVGGPDLTKWSCASLALAHAANKLGLDVTDYRGGHSQSAFGNRRLVSGRISKLKGVKSYSASNTNDYKSFKELSEKMEKGREYILSIGHHSSVVKKTDSGVQYLELQSTAERNGWHLWETGRTEKQRFDMQKSHSINGKKYNVESYLIDIESLNGNNDFRILTGYLNTATNRQMKGSGGYAK